MPGRRRFRGRLRHHPEGSDGLGRPFLSARGARCRRSGIAPLDPRLRRGKPLKAPAFAVANPVVRRRLRAMAVGERPFRIAHLSDLHCGGVYFEAALLERAISEINELQPDMVVCSGDLTTFGFKHEYQLARQYLDSIDCDAFVVVPGNHDARNVGYVHFEELFGDAQLRAAEGRRGRRRGRLDGARPRPWADRTWPLPLDRGAVRGRAGEAPDLRAPPSSAAGAGHRAGAKRRLRRGRRDRVPAPRGRPPRALGAQARSVCVAAREPLRRQHRARFRPCGSAETRGPVTT